MCAKVSLGDPNRAVSPKSDGDRGHGELADTRHRAHGPDPCRGRRLHKGDAWSDPVTEMSAVDAQWAAELMEKRRRDYVRYSPMFWRPAEGVVGLHVRFLRGRIIAETTVALRTRHGFIICERRGSKGLVDDFAIEPPGTWDSDGAALLLAAAAAPRRC